PIARVSIWTPGEVSTSPSFELAFDLAGTHAARDHVPDIGAPLRGIVRGTVSQGAPRTERTHRLAGDRPCAPLLLVRQGSRTRFLGCRTRSGDRKSTRLNSSH